MTHVQPDFWVVVATVSPILLFAGITSTRKIAKPENVGRPWAAWLGISFLVVVIANIVIELWALLRLGGAFAETDPYWLAPALTIVVSFILVAASGSYPYLQMYPTWNKQRKLPAAVDPPADSPHDDK